jgi:hypothetical protein
MTFLACFASQGVLNKDPNVWKITIISLNMNLTNSLFDELSSY